MVSESWKDLSPEDREVWEEKARSDKARYEVEKQTYNGPWKVAADKRSPKDPNAPKRPMSAFLSFSNNKRSAVKRQNPTVTNAEVSRILSRMWKDAPEDERQMHIDLELKLRTEYKSAMGEWRTNAEREKTEARLARENNAIKTLEAQKRQFLDGDTEGIRHQEHEVSQGFGLMYSENSGYQERSRPSGRGSSYYDAYDRYEHGQQESKSSAAAYGMQETLSDANALSLFQSGLPGGGGSLPNMLGKLFISFVVLKW
jgi:high mobility group protein B1